MGMRNQRDVHVHVDMGEDAYESEQLKAVQQEIDRTKEQMADTVDAALHRSRRLSQLQKRAASLSEDAGEYTKTAQRTRRFFFWKKLRQHLVLLCITLLLLSGVTVTIMYFAGVVGHRGDIAPPLAPVSSTSTGPGPGISTGTDPRTSAGTGTPKASSARAGKNNPPSSSASPISRLGLMTPCRKAPGA